MNAAHGLKQRIAKSFCFQPLADVLTRRSNALQSGRHFESSARGLPGGDEWFWN